MTKKWATSTDKAYTKTSRFTGEALPEPSGHDIRAYRSERAAYDHVITVGSMGSRPVTHVWVDEGKGLGWELFETIEHTKEG